MNPNMTRWIHASIAYYFSEYYKQTLLPYYVEAQERKTSGLQDWVEIRWDGPNIKQTSRTTWLLDVEINQLISSIIGRPNTHQHKKCVGLAQASYPTMILVKKYGDDPLVDTEEIVGCLQLKSGERESVATSYFGKIETDVVLEQSTVEAHYRMITKS